VKTDQRDAQDLAAMFRLGRLAEALPAGGLWPLRAKESEPAHTEPTGIVLGAKEVPQANRHFAAWAVSNDAEGL
jgi:hypothetical protein